MLSRVCLCCLLIIAVGWDALPSCCPASPLLDRLVVAAGFCQVDDGSTLLLLLLPPTARLLHVCQPLSQLAAVLRHYQQPAAAYHL